MIEGAKLNTSSFGLIIRRHLTPRQLVVECRKNRLNCQLCTHDQCSHTVKIGNTDCVRTNA